MKRFFADLHIHIGRTKSGKPVKITGAKSLTFDHIIQYAKFQKGLDVIGIIDSHSPEVLAEIEGKIMEGHLVPKFGGGLDMDGLTILLGSELEIYDENCQGPVHVLVFFPTIEKMKEFSSWLSHFLKNITLSSQRVYVTGVELQQKVKGMGGLFIPAHIFTPFKSLYGSGVSRSLTEIFQPDLIDAVEIGLSADTHMADSIEELHRYSYLTNSDAHSLAKMAREYQIIEMEEASFVEFEKVLKNQGGRRIVANYGLDPVLGKYHETVCAKCFHPLKQVGEICSVCGSKKGIKGVASRIKELSNSKTEIARPPYIHQVPLEFIPGLGKKTLEKLLSYFSTEMQIIHEVPEEKLKTVIPEKVAEYIVAARIGKLLFSVGGGGKYGKIDKRTFGENSK
ncbi:endonuclease Q family protein [Niallia nealsonii]|uniref:TIGR00375 family protein n=1 Tax=Niallia nealsonii TaxID=115979 RepID=A0A2N0YX91_9BACI|nr:endonuclease Q family protein [Niallia nealsonii]PKG21883.1 TIGR00375 family protein [Niallia nealsonii]